MENAIENVVMTRKLQLSDIAFDVMQKNGTQIMVLPTIFESEIDFFANRDLVEKSINIWKSIHPLLRCKIEYDKSVPYSAKYSYLPIEKQNANDNVEFLSYIGDSDADDCWKYVCYKEVYDSFDSQNDKLWRLLFLKLQNSNQVHKYCLVLSIHHAISDSLNAFGVIQELFEIIENLYLKVYEARTIEIATKITIPEAQNTVHDIICFDENVPFNNENCFTETVPSFLRPSKEALIDRTKVFNKNGVFVNQNNKEYLKVQDICNMNDNFTAFEMISYDSHVLKALLKSCKQHGTKLACCTQMIVAAALRKVIEKFSGDATFELAPFRAYQSINTRRFFDPPLDNRVMGRIISGILNDFDNSVNYHVDTEIFWKMVKKNNDELHLFLENKQFFDEIENIKNQEFYLKLLNDLKYKQAEEACEFFGFANIGVLNSISKDQKGLIKITEFYGLGSYSQFNNFQFAGFTFCTIDNRMMICLFYNNLHLSEKVAKYWIEMISDTIMKISQNE